MLEAADVLEHAGLLADMMRATAAVLARWEECKDDSDLTLDAALDRLAAPTPPLVPSPDCSVAGLDARQFEPPGMTD